MEFLRYSHDESLCNRFRGALLGLSLAPAALPAVQCPGIDGLTQPMLRTAAPKLLRYHDSWERRWDWVRSTEAFIPPKSSANSVAAVQVLILGDLLEMLLSCRYKLSGFTHLAGRSMRYDLPTNQQRYYQETLAKISRGRLPLFSLSSASAHNTFAGGAFVGGIVSALRQLESYGLSVQAAAGYGGIAPAIAGFLAGAAGGLSSLPVLWQIRDGLGRGNDVKGSEVIAIADNLFAQWAGQWAGMQ